MFHARGLWLKFHAALFEADRIAADRLRSVGCRYDGGRLDVANYPRKPRGLDAEAESAGRYDVRLSLCCSREGCRRRTTPPSARFLGRHVFGAVIVILAVCTLTTEAPPPNPRPSRQTLGRWRTFWRETLATSAAYIEFVAARMGAPIDPSTLPDALLDRFAGDLEVRLESTLRLLAPWTTISVPAESARSVMVR